jgi:hypothetical protein
LSPSFCYLTTDPKLEVLGDIRDVLAAAMKYNNKVVAALVGHLLCFIDKEPVVNGVANLMAFRTMSE